MKLHDMSLTDLVLILNVSELSIELQSSEK